MPAGQMDAVALVDPGTQAYPAEQPPLHTGEVTPVVAP